MTLRSGPVSAGVVAIDPAAPVSLQQQVERSLRAAIRDGRLGPGAQLPSTRGLSTDLGLSRGVVTAAYAQLAAEGYLLLRQGSRPRVSDAIRDARPRPSARSIAHEPVYDLRPGSPDLLGFPRPAWQRALARAWSASSAGALGQPDPRGLPALRDALCDYLDRVRGTAADPELLLVSSGFTQGLSLACRWLREYGVQRVALEDPGWHAHRLVAEQAGLEVASVAVDERGLDVRALEASGASAVVVTPAHQFPTGAVLAPDRRHALLEWAQTHDGLIVEDDYDSELRFDRTPVGALQGLAPDHVLHIGSASKRLAPGLRLGWMLVPPWLTWPLVSAQAVEAAGASVLDQLALAEFLGRGDLDRHLRRARSVYAGRRRRLLELVADRLPVATPGVDPAGLFECLTLPAAVDEAALTAAAARHGVGVEGLALHRHGAGAGTAPGILVGYGNAAPAALARAVDLLRRALAEA